jgi:hypothetical protein
MAPRAKTLDRIAVVSSVTADWLLRGDQPAGEVAPGRDPAWPEAVDLLRQAWRDPAAARPSSGCSRPWRRRVAPPGPR